MHTGYGLQFRTFVPNLMELLEDADGMVRDVARSTVIKLFSDAPPAAKSDLKRQLKSYNVRPTIVSTIMSQIGTGAQAEPEYPEEQQHLTIPSRPKLGSSQTTSQVLSERPLTPQPERTEHVEPLIIDTQRELEDTFREMHPFFEGKESEQNWLKREQSCTKIRRLNAGNSPREFSEMWVASIKALLDGILKAVNSLRTSLSKEGCAALQEIAKTTGPGLDSMVEILLQNLIKLCGGTKKIASAAGDATVDIIISHVSYSTRILQHIYLAVQDKNVQPRTYACGWLKTLLKKEAHHKSHVEHSGGLDLIEKCIKKGLSDRDPSVRERMRSTFWAFAKMWSVKAEALQGTLDAQQLKLLLADPGNPNSPKKAEPVARPGLGMSKTTVGPAKPSLRETMLAQKKAAMAVKNLPARPGSAMASLSPLKSSSSMNSMSAHASSTSSSSRSRPEPSSTVSHGGLSVAPMRPGKPRAAPAKAPSHPPRPATAGPYSVRDGIPASHSSSRMGAPAQDPAATPSARPASRMKARTPIAEALKSPKRVPPRPNTSQSNHSQTSRASIVSPVRDRPTFSTSARAHTPQPSPPRAIPQPSPRWHPQQSPRTMTHLPSPGMASPRASTMKPPKRYGSLSPTRGSPPMNDEEFTMVLPNVTKLSSDHPVLAGSPVIKESRASTPQKTVPVYEDPLKPELEAPSPPKLAAPPVLPEVRNNEDVKSRPDRGSEDSMKSSGILPEKKTRQNSEMLDSGIKKVASQTLDISSFRTLQRLVKNSDDETLRSDTLFDRLLVGLFSYLEAPLSSLEAQKAQDVKAQVLSTIKIMLRRDKDAVAPHAAKGIDSLLVARAQYEARARISSGLELLAEKLLAIGSKRDIASTIVSRLNLETLAQLPIEEASRMIQFGLPILGLVLESKEYVQDDDQVIAMGHLGKECISSKDSAVRKCAMEFCTGSLCRRVGEGEFWLLMRDVDEDGKRLMTYYIKKRVQQV